MALQVWLPLNGTLENKGLSNVTVTNNGATVDNNGKIGKCYQVDGSHYISFPSNPWMSMQSSYNFSLFLWVKGTSTSWLIAADGWELLIRPTFIRIGLSRNGLYPARLNQTFNSDTWYHLGFTWNGNTGLLKLYLNGEEKDSSTVPSSVAYNVSSTIKLVYGGTHYINDFRIYDHALSAKEVQEISKGLVLHYKLDDPYIEPTTNLITTEDCLSTTVYNGAKNKYGYGSNTDIYKMTGVFQGKFCTKIYMGTSGESAYPYPYISNIFVSDGTNAPEYKTISFDYYGTICTYMIPYRLGSGSVTLSWTNDVTNVKSGVGTNFVSIPIIPNKWNHITITLHGTTPANAECGYVRIGNTAHTSDTSNYWLFANMQIELKDHATPYAGIGKSRNDDIVYDSSGYCNHGTTIGTLTTSNDSPRYRYSTHIIGNTDRIQLPMPLLGEFTYTFWFKRNRVSLSNREMLLVGWYGISFELNPNNKLTFKCSCTDSHTEKNVTTTAVFNSTTEWYHVAFIHKDGVGSSIYVNGILDSSNSFSEIINYTKDVSNMGYYSSTLYFDGNISDFRIYSTVLSENDIKELYNTSAYIYKDGTIAAREFIEENTSLKITKTGIVGISNLVEIDSSTKILDDGSLWIRLLHHNNPSSNMFTSDNCWYKTDDENLYSILTFLKSTTWANDNGEYEFLIVEKLTSSSTENQYRWKLTSNPALSSTLTGYQLISGNAVRIIGLMNKGTFAAMHNGNSFWCLCGGYVQYSGGIAGAGGVVTTGYFDLYVRVFGPIIKGADINLCQFYENSIASKELIEI